MYINILKKPTQWVATAQTNAHKMWSVTKQANTHVTT